MRRADAWLRRDDADLYASESAWPGCPGLGGCAVVPQSVPQRAPCTIGLRSVKLCREALLDPVAQLVEQRTFKARASMRGPRFIAKHPFPSAPFAGIRWRPPANQRQTSRTSGTGGQGPDDDPPPFSNLLRPSLQKPVGEPYPGPDLSV